MNIKYSIIVPVYNEEETITPFYDAVVPIMEELSEGYEIIFVNDGSTDQTEVVLDGLCSSDKHIKYISFCKNYGQNQAIFAGLNYCKGEAAITMDVDLQDPVDVVPKLIEKWKEGYKIVHARRTKREGEGFFKKFFSKMYLKVYKKITKINIPANVGEFKLLDRSVIDVINSMNTSGAYYRGLVPSINAKYTFVDFVRNSRERGKTKYNFRKNVKLAINSILSQSTTPLTLSYKFGTIFSILSILCYITFGILIGCGINIGSIYFIYPTIVLALGIILIFNGISNAYMRKVISSEFGKDRYIVIRSKNIDK